MPKPQHNESVVDIFVIGGGVNGCGVARDAAGRGLSVTLAEMGDIASATSSASTKMFHGGLRYLEFFELGLVSKALKERETLLQAMPHISWPMRFILPYHKDMRFDSDTPTSRILQIFMPWAKGRRPAWLIRLGLFLYDILGKREILPGTSSLDLRQSPEGAVLQSQYAKAYEYSDCWVEDSRLVVLNARAAVEAGAAVLTQNKVVAAERLGGLWQITLRDQISGALSTHKARALVNAAGPWVADLTGDTLNVVTQEKVRLVRGSHIVTKKLFDHDKGYFFQGRDGRIIFALPYETDFTLIGTTDAAHEDADLAPTCTPEETAYLCKFASEFFEEPVTEQDIVWSYSGVRPLYDDGASSATAATRDYVLSLNAPQGEAPLLTVFGGKITTYRKLAEGVLAKLGDSFPDMSGDWTAGVALPGGDFAVDGVAGLIAQLMADYSFLTGKWAQRLVRGYGTDAQKIMGNAKVVADLGLDFGATLSEAELRWLMTHEFARSADDVLWRRTKLGLRLTAQEAARLETWMKDVSQ
ncbi:MAG: glycerol-3-phosphate dehydrogenase [Rhodobacteraceae bacterium]|nr:glycerol-3-phosphate dehydrogenase [Paracoccaceae bacterium]